MKKKAEVVFIPSPGVGHLVSTLEFAKLLVNRDDRLQITVLVIKFSPTSDTDAYTDPIASERLRVINLPEPHIVPSTSTPDGGSTIGTLLESQKPHVREAVSNLTATGGGSLAAFVVDMFCTTMIEVAREFKVPSLVFFTSGAAFLGLMLHLHTLKERDSAAELRGELDIPCFANPVPSNTLPSVVIRKEWEPSFMHYGRGLKEANGFILNSFEELEPHAVHSFSDPALSLGLPLYPVGPILNLEPKNNDKGTADDILRWLDDQPPSSVVFLCFGSRGAFDEEQVTEIARALEDSGARFLWSLRRPPPKGIMFVPPSDYTLPELAAVLPEGFLDRTAGIGRVIGWAPQAQVLAHPATGGFVSHCGWNSILESIYFGVPIATWPVSAEQQTNAFQLVRELRMAVEIALDYRVEMDEGRNFLLTADRIERGIRSVLDKDGEIRKKVKEMSEKSRKTLLEGGCSHTHLTRLIDYIMEQV